MSIVKPRASRPQFLSTIIPGSLPLADEFDPFRRRPTGYGGQARVAHLIYFFTANCFLRSGYHGASFLRERCGSHDNADDDPE